MEIKPDDLSGPEIALLLQSHLDDMGRHSPPESIHALDLDSLRQPDISFWSVWQNDQLLGCGALKKLDDLNAGEVKSMRTSVRHLRKGVAAKLLSHIVTTATVRAYDHLYLETGSAAHFEPARRLYSGFGFEECAPFAHYVPDPHSIFMTKKL